jgi:hypothetical protein
VAHERKLSLAAKTCHVRKSSCLGAALQSGFTQANCQDWTGPDLEEPAPWSGVWSVFVAWVLRVLGLDIAHGVSLADRHHAMAIERQVLSQVAVAFGIDSGSVRLLTPAHSA